MKVIEYHLYSGAENADVMVWNFQSAECLKTISTQYGISKITLNTNDTLILCSHIYPEIFIHHLKAFILMIHFIEKTH